MYSDLRDHIRQLDERGLLLRVDHPVNKDTEVHPLVRWQYRGGIAEADRKAFYFTNVFDSRGLHYDHPLMVAGLAGSRAIYATGLGCSIEEIGERWDYAFGHPIAPVLVSQGKVQEVVHQGSALDEERGGLYELPAAISTPGYDGAPYLTSFQMISKDPETGIANMGNYRVQIKGRRLCGVQFSPNMTDAEVHWKKARQRKGPLPVVLIGGAPPLVSYAAVQRLPLGKDEMTVAGGLAREPIRLVQCRTVDLAVPADAEIAIEGWLHTEFLEPEGPFGESHGYVHPRTMSPVMEVTCITHRQDYIMTSFISQVTPSESSTIKRCGYEFLLTRFLRDHVGIKSVVRVVMHESLTNLRPVVFLQFHRPNQGDVWRALKLTSGFQPGVGKMVIAVDDDIDPQNLDAVFWAMAYRMTPHVDMQILRGHDKGHAPPFRHIPVIDDSAVLINATLREAFPAISLPTRPFMERAKALWEEIGLPPLRPEAPWHGYSMTPWDPELSEEAQLAVEGRWEETLAKLRGRRINPDELL